jgi:hypothetical protein
MANALSTPPPPNMDSPQQQQPPRGGAMQGAPGGIPAPTHAQTVATLRHMSAVGRELETLLRNPDLGKADIRSDIIDAVTRLVADRILTAPQGVEQLGKVPDKPFDQKQMLMQLYIHNLNSEMIVLHHHRQAFVGTGDYPTESIMHSSDKSNDHATVMQRMVAQHYGKR